MIKTCLVCGAELGVQNRTGMCKPCQYKYSGASRRMKIRSWADERGIVFIDHRLGHVASMEQRIKMSCAIRGINVSEWDGFAVESKYCPKFNNACKERNRDKYGRMCFLCGKTEAENGKKLSVHHVDMNKQQGCDNHVWQLVPLCAHHHGTSHNEMWQARIEYLLRNVWCAQYCKY